MLAPFDHDDLVALALIAAIAGFAVLAGILLLRTRAQAETQTRQLQEELRIAQIETDRCRALLLAEPQILVAWRASDDTPEIVGDTTLLLPQGGSPLRLVAFGSWLAPEPALALEHAVD